MSYPAFKVGRIPWYVRLALYFVRPRYGYDVTSDATTVVAMKLWRGRWYVVDERREA